MVRAVLSEPGMRSLCVVLILLGAGCVRAPLPQQYMQEHCSGPCEQVQPTLLRPAPTPEEAERARAEEAKGWLALAAALAGMGAAFSSLAMIKWH